MDNKKIEFDLAQLTIETYTKIAMWNNSDFDTTRQKQDALKIISHDIVQNALEKLLKGIEVKTGTEVFRGDTKVGDSEVVKDTESFNQASEKQVFDKLFIKDEPKS